MSNLRPFGNPQRQIELGHSRVPYYRVGQGPDLLFIHGWPLHSATFRQIVPRLSPYYTCHLVDLPGSGDSQWDEQSKIGLRDHVASLQKIVAQLGLARFAIVAHDSGGAFARLMAADDARVTGLVLGNTEIPGHRPWQMLLFVGLERSVLGAWAFETALRYRVLRQSPLAYGGCFHDPTFAEGEFGQLFIAPMLKSEQARLGQRRLLRDFDWPLLDGLAEIHTRIHAPTKLIWGGQDPYFPVHKLEATLPQYAGGASLSVIPQGKLFVHEEYPEQFARETLAFLDTCDWSERADAQLTVNS